MKSKESFSQVPGVIRSRLKLIEEGADFLAHGALTPSELPIESDGTTYNMAQTVRWIDNNHFAVGRWDGSLSIFRFNNSAQDGPVISNAVSSPASEGVQMVTYMDSGVFSSSNDDESVVIWESKSEKWDDLQELNTLRYKPDYGVANSGVSLKLEGKLYLVVGHSLGFLTIWEGTDCTDLSLLKVLDIRAKEPVNPWGLCNIRGISVLDAEGDVAHIVTGSEDGDICVISVPDGAVSSRTRYNPIAQRGINSISAFNNHLLVANCSVGSNDKNIWLYHIDPVSKNISLLDSKMLRVNQQAPQVFNFSVRWGRYNDGVCFFSSTEEGALWMGEVSDDDKLSIVGYQEITSQYGSSLAFLEEKNQLIAVTCNLHEFKTVT